MCNCKKARTPDPTPTVVEEIKPQEWFDDNKPEPTPTYDWYNNLDEYPLIED